MTLYVDDAAIPADVHNTATGRTVSSRWSHLITDKLDPAELHEFATRTLGLRRSYLQRGKTIGAKNDHNPAGDHYDLTASKRHLAVRCGATPISARDLAGICRLKRAAIRLPHCGYAISHGDDGSWVVGLEWGQEAEGSPMVEAAAYGVGVTAWDAIEAALTDAGLSVMP